MLNLKTGEEHKTKGYCCVCLVKKKYSIEYLRSRIPSLPLVIEQKTPIRVLHRRTVATRSKTIHDLTIDPAIINAPTGYFRIILQQKFHIVVEYFNFYYQQIYYL